MDTRQSKNEAGVDKKPEGNEEAGAEKKERGDVVSNDDLKGKKVDADLSRPEDRPLER